MSLSVQCAASSTLSPFAPCQLQKICLYRVREYYLGRVQINSVKIFLSIFLFLLIFASGSAQPVFSATVEELQAQIEALKAQIAKLLPPEDVQFNRDLYFGMRNDADVKRLQEFLIAKNFLTVGSNTGNFFSITKSALSRYQISVGLAGIGYFGPLTRAKVNQIIVIERTIVDITQKISVTESQSATPILTPSGTPPPTDSSRTGPTYDIPAIARGVQDSINVIRASNGLVNLAWDDQLAQAALNHSLDQAADNIEITSPDLICHYPLIRHEGIRGGYSLGDRLRLGGVSYRSAGENIVMFSLAKDLVFQYQVGNPPPECPEVPKFTPGSGTQEERLALYNNVLSLSREAVQGLEPVDWIRKNWRTNEEVIDKAATLWMNSDGHRANILRSSFNFGGIGISKVNDYLIITHNFAGR